MSKCRQHIGIWAGLLVTWSALCGVTASAQHVAISLTHAEQGRQVYEVETNWDLSLAAIRDSLKAENLTESVLHAFVGGAWSTSEAITLPALQMPRLALVASSYDEIALPLDPSLRAALIEVLTATPYRLVSLGYERKQPTVTLDARMIAYDRERGVVRRYRSMTLAVQFAGGSTVFQGRAVAQGVENPHLDVTESVLASGTIYKVPITEEGIYIIDRAFLNSLELGVNVAAIDPSNVRVFGNGGRPVPALNGAERYADLVENPVWVQGGGDGSFGENDRILFYAAAPQGWSYDVGNEDWEHYVHPFSEVNYYFIKIDNIASARIETIAEAPTGAVQRLETVEGRYVVDLDEFIWSRDHGSGYTWVSTPIRGGGSRTVLDNSILPQQAAGTFRFEAHVGIQSSPRATVVFEVNGILADSVRARRSTGTRAEDPIASSERISFTHEVSTSSVRVAMALRNILNEPQAVLDWLRVYYPQRLEAESGMLRFSTPAGEDGTFAFALRGFSGTPFVWDVTEPDAIHALPVTPEGNVFLARTTVENGTQPREIIAFDPSVAMRPEAATAVRVDNQNLHGIQEFPEFVIVAPAIFRESAEELAAYRGSQGMRVHVAYVEQIYNEFSGGLQDMRAVRDYFKFLYDRAPDDQLLKYALLFGDGHFNYRELGATEPELANHVLPYQTEQSFNPDATFTSDDYFGLLDDNEGIWEYVSFQTRSNERLDLGIGRFPVQTPEEAQLIVQKIKSYENPNTYGSWRTRYTFAADDGPTGLDGARNEKDLHLKNANDVADVVEQIAPEINIKKVYGSSFERVFLNGFRIPGAKQAIQDAINEGTLLFNYSGHGGPDGLAQEEIFTLEDARRLTNADKLSVFVTATCSFGWWDLQEFQSGAEELLLNPNGGAVGVLTTVRIVYTSSDANSLNPGLNRAITNAMFDPDTDGLPARMGDALRIAKNTNVGLSGNSRKFNLLGDPTMRLGIPAREAVVESVNNVPVETQAAQVRALDRITIEGAMRTLDGSVDTNFDGTVEVAVFDAKRRVAIPEVDVMPVPYYTVREDLIWRGDVKATNGRFAATFVVPKDISYSNEAGRISLYAQSAQAHALGFTENVIVGGTSDSPPDDSNGPEITLFMNDTTFVSGGLTNASPELIVRLYDESGINTVGAGVGHEMLLVINGDEQSAMDISSQFRSEENSFQRGIVRWNLTGLEPGEHFLSVRAWDVLNNSGAARLDFVVTESTDLRVANVFNYPNPTSGITRFVFEHNQPLGTAADVEIRIYTLAGRLIRTLESDEALPSGVLPGGPVQVMWDGRDEDFDELGSGVYLYQVRIAVDGIDGERHVSEHIEKLALIR